MKKKKAAMEEKSNQYIDRIILLSTFYLFKKKIICSKWLDLLKIRLYARDVLLYVDNGREILA
ncbi:MAG: hypothetical protein ACFFAN_04620 [Promethearchaeota archaeon]